MTDKLALILPDVPMWIKLAALVLPMLPNFWCLFQAATKEFAIPAEKLMWLGAGMFLPVIGGLLFLVFGRRRIVRSAA